jgi:uncharacterized protein (UPF0332 family)
MELPFASGDTFLKGHSETRDSHLTEPLDALIQYRLERVQESLADARLLADAGRWNTCVNRLYHSCFYAVSALLVRDGLFSSEYTGVRSLFNRHYIRTGEVPRNLARVYNDLFERRQESDYADFVHFQADQVRPYFLRIEFYQMVCYDRSNEICLGAVPRGESS